jgi:hypothetical protein
MRILLAYGHDPQTTGALLERALRRRHDVLSFGPSIDRATLASWTMEALADRVRPSDLGYRTFRPAEALKALAPGWSPDLFLWVESGVGCRVEQLDRLGCPTAGYLIDTYRDVRGHLEAARRFDLVLLAQRTFVERFRAAGHAAHWLPVGCDPELHGERPVARLTPIAFAGTLSDRRQELLGRLAARYAVTVRRCFLEEMAELYSRALIVFNRSVHDDLNMRVFEAMAAGALLLTDPAPGSGLTELFEDGRTCALYRSDGELEEVAHRWLADRARREEVARRGQRTVLESHTYDHRVLQLEQIAGSAHCTD